jgi:hypothetical protein
MSNQSPLVLRAGKLRAARGAVVAATQVAVTAQPAGG